MSDTVAVFAVGAPGRPELDPELAGEEAPEPITPDEVIEPVSEGVVRTALAAAGGLVGFASRTKIPGQWRFSKDELDELTPPVTRMVNRNPALQRAIRNADAVAAGAIILKYLVRNLSMKGDTDDRHLEQPEGAGSPGGSGPARPDGGDDPSGEPVRDVHAGVP